MERVKYERDAVMRDVPNISKRVDFVSHMVQWLNVAATRGVPMELLRGEFVSRGYRSINCFGIMLGHHGT
jgi:hypothetical protein